jgi:hypothetical protein
MLAVGGGVTGDEPPPLDDEVLEELELDVASDDLSEHPVMMRAAVIAAIDVIDVIRGVIGLAACRTNLSSELDVRCTKIDQRGSNSRLR